MGKNNQSSGYVAVGNDDLSLVAPSTTSVINASLDDNTPVGPLMVSFLCPPDTHPLHKSAHKEIVSEVEYRKILALSKLRRQVKNIELPPPISPSLVRDIAFYGAAHLLSQYKKAKAISGNNKNDLMPNISPILYTYLSNDELDQYRVEIKNGRAYYEANGKLLKRGASRFVVINEQIYADTGEYGYILFHSFLSKGKSVAASGIFHINNDEGEITKISNESGHYRIPQDGFIDFLAYMLQQLNNPHLIFEDHTRKSIIRELCVLDLICDKKGFEPSELLTGVLNTRTPTYKEYYKSGSAVHRSQESIPSLPKAALNILRASGSPLRPPKPNRHRLFSSQSVLPTQDAEALITRSSSEDAIKPADLFMVYGRRPI